MARRQLARFPQPSLTDFFLVFCARYGNYYNSRNFTAPGARGGRGRFDRNEPGPGPGGENGSGRDLMSELLTGSAGERRLFLGNEAIVRGALEAGVALVATYPGTPASEIGDRCYEISRQTDLHFEYSVNEKVALEVAAGAAACGWRVLCAMKHVGLNVAADALMTLAYVGVKGGLVIVSADDPSLFSSQNEQDNRYYAKMAGLPMLEPATPQEAKEMTLAAFALSEELGLPVLLRTTTRVNHTRGPVTLGELAPRPGPGRFRKTPSAR